jgi:shikimate dehydrogenase
VDLVYGSAPTELAATCTSGGATLIDGLEVLVCQGADSFRIWVGQEPPVETMRRTIRDNR